MKSELLNLKTNKRTLTGLLLFFLSMLCCFPAFGPKKTVALYLVLSAAAALVLRIKRGFRLNALRILWLCFAVLSVSIASQDLSGGGLDNFTVFMLFTNTLTAAFFIALFAAAFGRLIPGVICGGVLLLLISLVNYFIFAFKGNALTPNDIYALTAAANVASQYTIVISLRQLVTLLFFVLVVLLGFCIGDYRVKRRGLLRGAMLLTASLSLCIWLYACADVVICTYGNEGAMYNGYITNYCMQLRSTVFRSAPDAYDRDYILNELAEKYTEEGGTYDRPNIIVIMDESFVDFSVLGDFETDKPVTPFIDSLEENTVKGYALSSTYGGGTSNSEYEFLTGNSMAFLDYGAAAYQMYVKKPSYSIVTSLEKLGYKTLATHPMNANSWSRDKVYPLLGFDEVSFIDDYPQQELIRGCVSDREMFEYIISKFNDKAEEDKLFVFGVTMQNHGGYSEAPETENVALVGESLQFDTVNNYLSLIHETDRAVEYLVSYFEGKEEKTLILLFGDHYPCLPEEFYAEIADSESNIRVGKYTVPFFIWTNYDIEEKEIPLTSLNFLSIELFEAAGLPLPPYTQFLKDTNAEIPAINGCWYFSQAEQKLIDVASASGKEKEALALYEQLQYNCIFDKYRSDIFFPLPS